MGRPRNPERDKSLKRYMDSEGKITIKELAELAGVPEVRIRKWKSEDSWEDALKRKPKKRGGQKGNKNAAGKTPNKKGNRNAMTHGAFATIQWNDIDPETAEEIGKIKEGQAMIQMIKELQSLQMRKAYLEGLLKKYESPEAEDKMYVDKVMHMIVPKSMEEKAYEADMGIKGEEIDPEPPDSNTESFKTAMKTIIKSSAFDRSQKIEAELNKLHGRIIKQLDSIKSYEIEQRHIELAERRFKFDRQKAAGAFEYDEVQEEIIVDEGNMDNV